MTDPRRDSPPAPPPGPATASPTVRGSRKLRLAPLWPALAALAVMAATLAWALPPLFERSGGEALLDASRLVNQALAEDLAAVADAPPGDRGSAAGRRLQDHVTRLSSGTSLRLTVIAEDGTVRADSDRSWEQVLAMENHRHRPEVAAARREGTGVSTRRSDTTGRRYVYATTTLPGDAHYIRLAQPVEELRGLYRHLFQAAALALLATLAAIAILSMWLDRRLLQPLAQLIDGAGSLATGRYRHRRLAVPEQRDLAELAGAINRMTANVEEQIAAVETERDYLSTILASMSEGVLVVDGEGRAVLANPAFRRLFGLPRQVEGRLPFEVARHPELAEVIRRTLRSGEEGELEARIEEVVVEAPALDSGSQNGPRTRTVALVGSALRRPAPSAKHEPGGVVVARDTTEATRLTQMRRDFVANVSHELKTPLSAIRGYAETLRDGALEEPAAASRFTGRILRQCHHLQALLDDLLILSRLESVEIPLEAQPMNIVAIAERCLETIAPQAAERHIDLIPELPAGAPDGGGGEPGPSLAGDRGALERLLLNLLENAIKYNQPGGEVRLRVRFNDPEGGGGEVLLEVADTGLGIPPDSLPRIFERFYRVDKGRARDEGGTGLGLAIVKHVAQAHGGRVEVESQHREGSVFRVYLPLATHDTSGDTGVWRRP